jgi:hypothetical protein
MKRGTKNNRVECKQSCEDEGEDDKRALHREFFPLQRRTKK